MYSLVGIDGNAFNIMGYVTYAMKRCQFEKSEIDKYLEKATSGTYSQLIVLSLEYLDKCNERAKKLYKNNV